MLETLRNAFKIEDIRKRIGYTFLMLIVIRIGSQLPIPCVNSEVFANWFANQGALRRYKINETYMKYLCNLYICHIEKSIKSMIYEKQN